MRTTVIPSEWSHAWGVPHGMGHDRDFVPSPRELLGLTGHVTLGSTDVGRIQIGELQYPHLSFEPH